MKKRVLSYSASVASVYLTMHYLTKLFLEMISNFTVTVI
jgi:hypothetical protein